ncbi:PEP/pyruvate-binding domain-containing protein [Paenibacillus allorhizosphaerae]|uniref:Phosphoenolpyruvate synthase n=1 Tax=Paenibacillus allorhizosphaerae TaxID=2849866 RepID=A0ABM8VG98_9BACL|nr:PEP/pyruvate-binding domain-containing protein [Paenibacillus allorhizosphaerae]CAG7637843.1 Phosphoenolpyruvate synthase [Paenibacillus allorhizosphaerae]
MFTVALNKAGQEPVVRIGSKALQLARLTGRNIAIPGGFVITSEALERFLSYNGIQPGAADNEFEARLLDAAIPDDVQSEVAAAFEHLNEQEGRSAVAVRSSSSAEDLENASFAGQYETILNVTDLPHLLESLKRCWASLFSARVQGYALQSHIDWNVNDLPMGVLVQRMVQADVSGVVFSMNPVTQNKGEMIINASYGLGEAVVSGLVTPDAYFIEKQSGSIHKELGCKEMKIVAAAKGTVEAETTQEEQNRFCLTDDQVRLLADQTKTIEALYENPVDIEFAVKDGRVYILQVRPVTA